MTKPKKSAKEKFLEAALDLFAERGYYGVSLADVANELGLTKQSIIYHFKTKEALYGEVLEQLSERFETVLEKVFTLEVDPNAKWQQFVSAMHEHLQATPADARLILRELLDNNERAQESHRWYLKRFLDESVVLIGQTEFWKGRPINEQTAAIYQVIGAINYFAVSGATLQSIWGTERLADMKSVFLDTLQS